MKETPRPNYRALPFDLACEVDDVCCRFERAWSRAKIASQRPCIGDYLNHTAGPGRSALLGELIALDIAYRRRGGENPQAGDYEAWFIGLDSAQRSEVRVALQRDSARREPDVNRAPAGEGADQEATGPSFDLDAQSTPHDAGARPVLADETVPAPPFLEAARSAVRYRLQRLHGEGGLGQVYLAHDEQLQRPVALKYLHPDQAGNSNSQLRFRQEAEVTARLEHPGIVPVFALAKASDRRLWYAMRFVQGETLRDAIKRLHAVDEPSPIPRDRNLGFRQLLTRFVAVCNTVAFAHSRGTLHRDLKPDNIMLGEFGETLVLDWGLAKQLAPVDGARQTGEESLPAHPEANDTRTKAGQVIGTPAYMSPEQAAGRNDLLGPASDIYNLGATLYFLLTGQAPFQENTVQGILAKVQEGDFPPPRKKKFETPRALEAICLRAMARKPEDRYATAQELAADVERWFADEPVTAFPEPWTGRLRRWLRQHRTGVAAAAVTVLVATVSLAAATWLSMDAKARAQATAQQLEVALQSEREAKNLAIANLRNARFAVGSFYQNLSVELWHIPGTQELRKRLVEVALDLYKRYSSQWSLGYMPADPDLIADIAEAHYQLGYLATEMGSKDKALEAYLHARSFLERLVSDNPDSGRYQDGLARGYNLIGAMQLDLGQRVEALQTYQQARTLFQKLVDADPSPIRLQGLALSCHGLAALQEEPAAALGYYQQAICVQKKLIPAKPDDAEFEGDLAQSYNNFGILQIVNGQHEDGLRSLEEARALRAKLVQNYPTKSQFKGDLANSYHTIGDMQRDTDPATARRALEEARGIAEKLFQTNPANGHFAFRLAEIYHSLALLQQATDLAAAQRFYEQAGAHFEKLVQAHPAVRQYRVTLAENHHDLGTLRRRMKQPTEARSSFQQACDHWDWVLERDPEPRRDRVRLRRALSQAYLGEQVAATEVVGRITETPRCAGELLYDAARVYAICAATSLEDAQLDPVDQSRLAQQYALEAVALLTKARAAGYFQTAARIKHLANDADLESLRDRGDFRKFVGSLEDNTATAAK